MADENATLSTFYESWKLYQDHLAQALAPLTAEQLALRAAPNIRSIGEDAAHIVSARVGWFVRFLGEEAGDAAPYTDWNTPDAPARTAAELVQGLEVSWKLMADALARWSSADMAKTFSQEWRENSYELSRSWVIWHLLEHDLHHGGEISLTLGMHSLQAPDI